MKDHNKKYSDFWGFFMGGISGMLIGLLFQELELDQKYMGNTCGLVGALIMSLWLFFNEE